MAGCASGPADSGWPLVVDEALVTAGCLDHFAYSDTSRWRRNDDARGDLELLGDSHYAPPVRSPTSIALWRSLEVADFNLEVELLQTGRDYGHRDLCLFFGFQSPTRFYYVHLAPAPDANAHNVFLVNDAPRTNLAPVPARGVDWGHDVWHHVRIERRTATGTIRVFWDRGTEPILDATSTTFAWGRIGFGSFDDSGRFRSLRVWAPNTRPPAAQVAFQP
ncbi:MAG: hypothetical protein ABIP94_06425 [Planctomycetota bacterium]